MTVRRCEGTVLADAANIVEVKSIRYNFTLAGCGPNATNESMPQQSGENEVSANCFLPVSDLTSSAASTPPSRNINFRSICWYPKRRLPNDVVTMVPVFPRTSDLRLFIECSGRIQRGVTNVPSLFEHVLVLMTPMAIMVGPSDGNKPKTSIQYWQRSGWRYWLAVFESAATAKSL